MPANKIKLEICGSNYVIATTDTEEYVLSLAEKLDSDMTQMLASNPTASVTTAAVITALGYLDELKKSTSGADNMRAQIKDYLEDAAKAKLAAEEARREVERLRREIGYLKEKKECRATAIPQGPRYWRPPAMPTCSAQPFLRERTPCTSGFKISMPAARRAILPPKACGRRWLFVMPGTCACM